MLKKYALPALLFSMLLHGQASSAETTGVVATFKPLHSMVSGVIGDTGEATLLIDGSDSPHGFQLRPSQVMAMQSASVIFYIDDTFERFLERAFDVLPENVRTAAMADKANLTMLTFRAGGAWERHGHGDHDHEGHDHEGEEHNHDHEGHDHEGEEHDHAHDHEGEEQDHEAHDHAAHDHDHGDHDHGDFDMHLWLSPNNARGMVRAIEAELSEIFPENSDIYNANANAYIEKIDTMDAEIKSSLEGLQDKPFIVFHDAYQYFEYSYGLSAVGSLTFEPDELPSPNRIREVREKVQETGAKCVFREPQFSDRLINTVAEGSNVKTGTLDPLGSDLANDENLYPAMMIELASDLKACLAEE